MVFLAVAMAVVAAVYFMQLRGPQLESWGSDLDQALTQARAEKRKVLVFFTVSLKSEKAKKLINLTLAHNRRNIDNMGLIKVNLNLDVRLQSKTAERYKISRLPTFLLLSPQGSELNRREGFVSVQGFRDEFLSCEKIIRPSR